VSALHFTGREAPADGTDRDTHWVALVDLASVVKTLKN